MTAVTRSVRHSKAVCYRLCGIMSGNAREGNETFENSRNGNIIVKVKHGSNPDDISLSLLPSDTLKIMKDKVKLKLNCPDKYVRLIFGGKLLGPDSASVSKLGIQDGSFIHAVITSQIPRQQSQVSSQPAPSTPSGNRNIQSSQHRGFDRLTELGLSLDETAALRSSFQSQVDELSATHPQRADEDEHSYRFRLEELWISQQGPTSEFTLNLPRSSTTSRASTRVFNLPSISSLRSIAESSLNTDDDDHSGHTSGTLRDFVWGVFLGSALGFLMIFCVWDRNISQRQKLGIMVGISLNMFIGYLQNSSTSSPPTRTSSSLRKSHPIPSPQQITGDSSVDISLELPVS